MYIHSVKLINFKSIGDYPEAEVILEPRVTAIIGKNESGKSNVLEGLSYINFIKRNQAAFTESVVNRNSPSGTENTYEIILKPTSVEKTKGIDLDTKVIITKSTCEVTGGFVEYYKQNILQHIETVSNMLDEIGDNPFKLKDQELTNYRTYKKDLLNTEPLRLYRQTAALDFLYARINSIPTEHRNAYQEKIGVAREKWTELLGFFPKLFYRKTDKHLKTSYKLEDIEKELKNAGAAPNSLLYDFVKLIGVSSDDFLLAARSGILPKQESLRKKINRMVDEKINRPFNDFYQTETIILDLSFNAGNVSFTVQSEEGETLLLSERSNGLRWYLETFIDAQANDANGCNIVYLLDEPGTSLHVNAQRELLDLFQHLAGKGNQVVYTTHSPYMLDLEAEGVHRIRAVVKNKEGYSYVYKTAYDARIAPDSQKDTLAPIISAIGMNLNDTFGPAKDKLNIVTEGTSDYIFLNTMAKILEIDTEKYAIIPAVGASNCVHICSILQGWGCRYIALFDYDDAGVQSGGEYMRTEMMFEYKCQYCYLADVSQEDVDNKTYKKSKYMIEDVVTREEINNFCDKTGTSKTIGKPLMAKLISNAIELGTYEIGEGCRENFMALFERIFSYFDEVQ